MIVRISELGVVTYRRDDGWTRSWAPHDPLDDAPEEVRAMAEKVWTQAVLDAFVPHLPPADPEYAAEKAASVAKARHRDAMVEKLAEYDLADLLEKIGGLGVRKR